MFSKTETCGKHIFSLVLRAVNIYIFVFNNFKNQRYCDLFYEIMGPPFWLNSSLMPYSLAFNSFGRFYVNDYNAKMKPINACNNSSGRYGIRLQVTQPFLKFQYLFQSLKKNI